MSTRRVPLLAWEFRRLGATVEPWRAVELPHNPFVADDDGRQHWFGECEYRHAFDHSMRPADAVCVLHVGAAMHTTRVLIDEQEVAVHRGGYLPFEVDLTASVRDASPRFLRLLLSNRDDPNVPPGKAFADLDFCWYGGLYRDAELRIRPSLHVTDDVAANAIAGGGVFVRTLEASEAGAAVRVQTQVRNAGPTPRTFRVRSVLTGGGKTLGAVTSAMQELAPGAALHVVLDHAFSTPPLWSITSPQLCDATVTVLEDADRETDLRRVRFGIRRLAFSRSDGFVLNGRPLRLRGTNRHQEMPRVGYAAPRAAQFRDARRIKEAGFDYVRLSHYPQSPDFLDACDELGLVVMNCIPGWQFMGGPAFRNACYDAARDLIRRDRNHPSIILWELSLNETAMDDEFMARLHAIGHEEYPGDQMFTAGWIDRYDVFIHSRQHGRIHTWRNDDKALVIAEYGDWEFYARNEGFDQKTGAGVFDRWSTSRQFRASGERGLRQQAFNHIVALNDTLSSPAVLDGQWAMFDYARGYDPVRAAVGVMDLFRVPKFSYHFYRSQRSARERGPSWNGGPMVFIASHWLPTSDRHVWVFSNCEEVELHFNGTSLGRRRPVQTAWTQHLPHPPFYFEIPRFLPGTLEAAGFVEGKLCAMHSVATPGAPARLQLSVDDLGIFPGPGENDIVIAHALMLDRHDSLCVTDSSPVAFSVDDAEIVGSPRVLAEAGVASVVIRLPRTSEGFALTAHAAPIIGAIAELSWRRRHESSSHSSASPPKPALLSAS